jgi:alkylhydroperoxidase family enzyme
VVHGAIAELGVHARDARQRALIELTVAVTVAPWTLSRAFRARANADGLTDDDLLHAIALSAYFGHLNRIADAVGVPLDYPVEIAAPHADPSRSPFEAAPEQLAADGALALDRRPTTRDALAAWQIYLAGKPGPLAPDERRAIAHRVARLAGDGTAEPTDALDADIRALVDLVALAPWRLDDVAYRPLRARGFDDVKLFDVCIAASTAGVTARIAVASRALAR